ncbi:MAG: hypothetical protein JNM39_07255 [Bdellovibrionaceae bacterium]|nr:hypothetical protein [Pseudobdellovibrionaceae bacterium]
MKLFLAALMPICLVPLTGFADRVKLLEENTEALQARMVPQFFTGRLKAIDILL